MVNLTLTPESQIAISNEVNRICNMFKSCVGCPLNNPNACIDLCDMLEYASGNVVQCDA